MFFCPVHKTKMLQLFTSCVCEACEAEKHAPRLNRELKFVNHTVKYMNGLEFQDSTLLAADFGIACPDGNVAVFRPDIRPSAPLLHVTATCEMLLNIRRAGEPAYVVKSRYGRDMIDIELSSDVRNFLMPHTLERKFVALVFT